MSDTTNPTDIELRIGDKIWAARDVRFKGKLEHEGKETPIPTGTPNPTETPIPTETPNPTEVPDDDTDGVANRDDECPNSDPAITVIIDGCDSGVENVTQQNGCNISDLITRCKEKFSDNFELCVDIRSRIWVNQNIITGGERGAILECIDASNIDQ